MNASWSHFTKRIPVYTSADRLYKAWTTRIGLESWFLRQALFLTPNGKLRHPEECAETGDRYIWLWHGWPDDVTEHREVLEVNGTDFLQFRFTGDCRVSVTIREEHDAALCELVQDGIPLVDDPARNLFVGCGEGWTFYLSNLKSILEGGIDLRNKNMFIKGVINS